MLLEPISADKCTQILWKLNPPKYHPPKCIHTHTTGIIELAITVRCITKESILRWIIEDVSVVNRFDLTCYVWCYFSSKILTMFLRTLSFSQFPIGSVCTFPSLPCQPLAMETFLAIQRVGVSSWSSSSWVLWCVYSLRSS